MTQPEVVEPSAETQDMLDAEALEYEMEAEAVVAGPLVAATTAAALALTAFYIQVTAGSALLTAAQAATVKAKAASLYGSITPAMAAALQTYATGGLQLGVDQAQDALEASVDLVPNLDPETLDVIASVDARASDGLMDTVTLARIAPMTTMEHVTLVTTQGHKAANAARQDTRWAINRAINAGAVQVAEAAGHNVLWVAERDACLHCLGLSGVVVSPGDNFPDITYADKPLKLSPVPYPPRHPNCRCRVRPWSGPPGTMDIRATDAPSALLREARRSVVRGWSEFDSQAARLRAADRLLQAGARLPKTVEARARAAVRRGKFPK